MSLTGIMLVLLLRALTLAAAGLTVYCLGRSIYNVFFHPLRRVPGPFFAKITRLWLFYHDYGGNPHNHIRNLHLKLGPLVRISPNEVSVDDVKANNSLYSQSNPWVKPPYHYKAFQSSPAYSIFTELDPATHASHLRLLAPAFSQSRVTSAEAQELLWSKCDEMVRGIKAWKHQTTGVKISLTKAFRSFALDVVTVWTFGRCANSLDNFHSDLFEVFDVAAESVIYYAKRALDAVKAGDQQQCIFSDLASPLWQEKRGYTPSDGQVISDGIVILAAGADTTAAALSIGIHHLTRQPELWKRLQDEVRPIMAENEGHPRLEALNQLPLLSAVIKEGLRVSCPIRGHMPRVVPAGGWQYKGTNFPAGSIVATSAFYGCYNGNVFPEPDRYDPTRWLVDDTTDMEAHLLPFSRGTRQCIGQK
ncbi:putative sterigmatocystin biosynthesis P450 monooxygenase STCB-like protein 4 [Colletotrichum chlorophyti]|uniref:Putative sterigmatocystin biosynthesis P450 monooxygenase STCB-like protein 4 n=1 Tax=Colletotrichum chlorophyti TaxID=708187 RepID=A0A1Q8RGG7_9PEZI|nr:putative sterigmatocystin biosynthesis P450 monooxygenase STCB-like protein 4 [Colletotrichum chlorophyti]